MGVWSDLRFLFGTWLMHLTTFILEFDISKFMTNVAMAIPYQNKHKHYSYI